MAKRKLTKAELNKRFKQVLSKVKRGLTITTACELAGLNRGGFYRRLTVEQKLELDMCRASNNESRNDTCEDKNSKKAEDIIVTPQMRKRFWEFNINPITGMLPSNDTRVPKIDLTVKLAPVKGQVYHNLQI